MYTIRWNVVASECVAIRELCKAAPDIYRGLCEVAEETAPWNFRLYVGIIASTFIPHPAATFSVPFYSDVLPYLCFLFRGLNLYKLDVSIAKLWDNCEQNSCDNTFYVGCTRLYIPIFSPLSLDIDMPTYRRHT